MTIKQKITEQLKKVIEALHMPDIEVKVEYPADPKHGDYATNVALVAFKKVKGEGKRGKEYTSPMELAEKIAKRLEQRAEGSLLEKIEVVRPGFINFWVKDDVLISSIEESSLPDVGKGKSVVVEYSSPNIAKPFTIGHLRSTIIGDAVANLLQTTGWKVYRDNHVGDWGTQFGKQIYAIKTWGNEAEIEKSDRPVKLLVDLYVRFHEEAEKNPSLEGKAREWFKKLEDGDPEARGLWQKCIDWSWKEFTDIYDRLNVPSGGVTFENDCRGYGESFFEDKMAVVIEELEQKKLLTTGKEGAQIVSFPEETKLPPLMILKKDGATLYSTRDLATDKFRKEKYGKDVTIINEVGAEQSLYFNQLYKLEEMLGWYTTGQRVHIKHGLYRFKDQKMSTRKGNVIWLEDVLHDAYLKAHEIAMEVGVDKKGRIKDEHILGKGQSYRNDITKKVAIGALKWNDLKRSPEQDITFDWDDLLNMQGNSGPYIQYTYARTQSVLVKGKETFTLHPSSFTLVQEERKLLLLLFRFPEIVEEAAVRLAPNVLCTYLFDVAQSFNQFYQVCPILKPKGRKETDADTIEEFRLFITKKTGLILKHGLSFLGIQAPEKM